MRSLLLLGAVGLASAGDSSCSGADTPPVATVQLQSKARIATATGAEDAEDHREIADEQHHSSEMLLVEFVGTENNDRREWISTDAGYSATPVLRRPSWIKTFRCAGHSHDSCDVCWDKDDCWSGRENSRVLTTPSGNWTRFVNSIHVQCNTETFTLRFRIGSLQCGILRLVWDGKEIMRQTSANVSLSLTTLSLDIESEGGHVLDFEFVADGANASVEISELQMFMPESFVHCEDFKMCLDPLHVHDAEARQLRNRNDLQLACLQAEAPASATCLSWRRCLGLEQQISLLRLLNAAVVYKVSTTTTTTATMAMAESGAGGTSGNGSSTTPAASSSSSSSSSTTTTATTAMAESGAGGTSGERSSTTPAASSSSSSSNTVTQAATTTIATTATTAMAESGAGWTSGNGSSTTPAASSSSSTTVTQAASSGAPGDGSATTLPASSGSSTHEASCVDPAVDDAESWSCDCLSEMQANCRRVAHLDVYSEELCLRAQMCGHVRVCEHWKRDAQCQKPTLMKLREGLEGRRLLDGRAAPRRILPNADSDQFVERVLSNKRCP